MKIFKLIFFAVFALAFNDFAFAQDIRFTAMEDEMKRTLTELKIPGEEPAYYVNYALTDRQIYYTTAYFGQITNSYDYTLCEAQAFFRVGDYEFDNTNYTGGNDSDYIEYCSIDGNYDSVRRAFWNISDRAYKDALETLARKKAFAEKQNITDKLPDFTKAEPTVQINETAVVPVDRKKMEETVKKISGVFKKYKEIDSATASFSATNTQSRMLDSEGSKTKESFFNTTISFVLNFRDHEGITKTRSFSRIYVSTANIPSDGELVKIAENYAKEIKAFINASTVTAYIGPILFEKTVAGVYFGNMFASAVSWPRSVWSEDGFDVGAGEFNKRLGLRVSAPFINIVDNPLIKEYNGIYLSGAYDIDDEGVRAEPVQLVTKGKLVGFPMSRTPTKDFNKSNGHGIEGRNGAPAGKVTNLFIESTKTVPDNQLREKLLERVKELELDYGIIVTDLDGELIAYKLYLDGKTELVRGLEFRRRTSSSLRNVIVTGTDKYVYNTNGRSVVAPSMLIDEFELENTTKKPEKFPYLSKP